MPKVPLQGLALNTLADGYAGKAIDACIRDVVADIVERGHDGKPRKVLIELTLTPDETARVEVDVQVQAKKPPYRTPTTQAKYNQAAGGLMFNTDCAENPDQMTLADIDDDAK